MWKLRSLGYRTDLFVCGFDGIVEDRGRYIVVRTPASPQFIWGNYLLYPDAPTAADHATWVADHARELPDTKIKLLAWDRIGEKGELTAFLDDGFALDDGTILTLTPDRLTKPAKHASDVEVGPVRTDRDWADMVETLLAAYAPKRSGSLDELRTFLVEQLALYRRMQDARFGQWYAARIGGEMACALGLVRDGELGRFQLVGTDPRFARRGACSTLVHDVASRGFAEGATMLVMAADATYHAARVYESVGFREAEHLYAVVKRPPAE